MEQCGGGVGRNIAEALWRLMNGRTKFLTSICDDADGRYLTNIAPGIILDGMILCIFHSLISKIVKYF